MSQTVRIELATKPHSPKQKLIMNALSIPGLQELWVAAGNKFGKTISLSTAFASVAPLNPNSVYRWIAPIYDQSAIGYDYMRQMLPGEPYVKANQAKLTLSFPAIETRVEFWHGQHPLSLEGAATKANALDEAAKLKEQVYHSAKTTTVATAGPIIGFSTPFGKNWFYRKCMEAQEEMIRAKYEGRRPTKIYIHAPSTANPHLPPTVIEDARRTWPERLYRQQFLAEFLDEGSVFTNLMKCYYTDYIDIPEQTFSWEDPSSRLEELEVTIGIDWAKSLDYTVFTASDPKSRKMVAIERMNGISYKDQIAKLLRFTKKFKGIHTVWHDRTGVGEGQHERLQETELPVRGITFTNESKNELMVALMVAFEDASYHIPQIGRLVTELINIEATPTLLGAPRYAAAAGGHDDIVMSLALSHLAMKEHSEQDYSILVF